MSSPTVTKQDQPISLGRLWKQTITYINGPTSYDTGGSVITARDLGMTTLAFVDFLPMLGDQQVLAVFVGNDVPETSVKMLITSLAGTEVAGASNQSAKKYRVRATGLY